VFLKLKKEANWVPKFFNESRLPETMPSDLQQIIKNYVKNDKKNAVNLIKC
jgi:type IV secretory pathway VirJ component